MSTSSDGTISTSGSFTMWSGDMASSPRAPAAEAEFNEAADEASIEVGEAAGCKKDDDCQTGGDTGGYCKENGDCHCTMPFFATTGTTCELSCTPTSKPAACCRDDADCQAHGDKNAYCKSPKSTPHTTPGNGMCRCDAGFTGTTSCSKDAVGVLTTFTETPEPRPHRACFMVGAAVVALLALLVCRRRRRAALEGQYNKVLSTGMSAKTTSEDQI